MTWFTTSRCRAQLILFGDVVCLAGWLGLCFGGAAQLAIVPWKDDVGLKVQWKPCSCRCQLCAEGRPHRPHRPLNWTCWKFLEVFRMAHEHSISFDCDCGRWIPGTWFSCDGDLFGFFSRQFEQQEYLKKTIQTLDLSSPPCADPQLLLSDSGSSTQRHRTFWSCQVEDFVKDPDSHPQRGLAILSWPRRCARIQLVEFWWPHCDVTETMVGTRWNGKYHEISWILPIRSIRLVSECSIIFTLSPEYPRIGSGLIRRELDQNAVLQTLWWRFARQWGIHHASKRFGFSDHCLGCSWREVLFLFLGRWMKCHALPQIATLTTADPTDTTVLRSHYPK